MSSDPGAGFFFFSLSLKFKDDHGRTTSFCGRSTLQKMRYKRATFLRCRPADRPQRGGRGQPGGDPRVRQSFQDPPPVAGPDPDPGGPGAERRRGPGLQPVRHLQVRAQRKEAPSLLDSWSVLGSEQRKQTELQPRRVALLVLLTAIYLLFTSY